MTTGWREVGWLLVVAACGAKPTTSDDASLGEVRGRVHAFVHALVPGRPVPVQTFDALGNPIASGMTGSSGDIDIDVIGGGMLVAALADANFAAVLGVKDGDRLELGTPPAPTIACNPGTMAVAFPHVDGAGWYETSRGTGSIDPVSYLSGCVGDTTELVAVARTAYDGPALQFWHQSTTFVDGGMLQLGAGMAPAHFLVQATDVPAGMSLDAIAGIRSEVSYSAQATGTTAFQFDLPPDATTVVVGLAIDVGGLPSQRIAMTTSTATTATLDVGAVALPTIVEQPGDETHLAWTTRAAATDASWLLLEGSRMLQNTNEFTLHWTAIAPPDIEAAVLPFIPPLPAGQSGGGGALPQRDTQFATYDDVRNQRRDTTRPEITVTQ